MIALYDLDDGLVTVFDDYKECAKYFNTTVNCIKSYISRSKKGILDKKRLDGKWYRLLKFDESGLD